MTAQALAALAVVALVLGSVGAMSTRGGAPDSKNPAFPGVTDSLTVAATNDYGYQPSTFEQIPTNATVNVTMTDDSNLPHTFTIIGREGWVVPASISATDFSNLVFGHSPPIVFNLNVSSTGDVATGSFQSPGLGWYEFVCTVPGHFQSGMYGFIAFGENLPANLTPNSRVGVGGGNLGVIEAAGGGAAAVAVILGIVVWRRRHPGHRMPPESL
ncbi:MAG: sulfocyanin-like copper-binding protein [Thermoplasmata archaeon]